MEGFYCGFCCVPWWQVGVGEVAGCQTPAADVHAAGVALLLRELAAYLRASFVAVLALSAALCDALLLLGEHEPCSSAKDTTAAVAATRSENYSVVEFMTKHVQEGGHASSFKIPSRKVCFVQARMIDTWDIVLLALGRSRWKHSSLSQL